MKIWTCAQGSQEWFDLRAGIPTASEFDNLLTPKTMKPSESAVKYRNRLLAEYILGRPLDTGYQSPRMEAGNLYEQEAAADYEFKHADGMNVETVGFVTHDGGLVGCSPDRFVGDRGILELKVNSPAIHVGYLINPETLRQAHRCQTQGQLLVCNDRAWVDTASYCKELNSLVVVRSERETEFQEKLEAAVWKFVADLMEQRTYLEMKYGPFTRPKVQAEEESPFGISADDVQTLTETIWNESERLRMEVM